MGYISTDPFLVKHTGENITNSYFRIGNIITIERYMDGTYCVKGFFERYYNNENVSEKIPLAYFNLSVIIQPEQLNTIADILYNKLKETYPHGIDC